MVRKMKDSGIEWVGEISKTWTLIPLKRVFDSRDGGAWGTEPQDDELDRVCIRVADFNFDKLTVKESEGYTVRNYDNNTINKLLLQRGDILVEKSGGGDITPVGRVIGFDLPIDAIYANFIERLRPNSLVRPKYILYYLALHYYVGVSKKYIKQTTGIQNLDLSSLLTEYISIPSLSEQQAIAAYLDRKCSYIDSIIERQKAVIEKLKLYKQSIITEAVTKGLDPTVKMKPSGVDYLGEIPQGWETKRLKYLFRIKKDIAGKEGYEILSVTQKGIKVKDISNNEGQIAQDYSKYQLVQPDDFIMNHMDLLTGFVDCSKVNGVTSPDYRVFFLKNPHLNSKDYYNYFLQLCYFNKIFYGLGQGVSGLGRWRLQTDKFLNFVIPIPPLDEQQMIFNYLDKKCDQIDKAIGSRQNLIAKLTEYKQSLIYECVTGKRKVV